MRITRVVLAAAHLDHDPGHNRMGNLKSLCQRCRMLHDRPYHLAQRWLTYRLRYALGDLFHGPYLRARKVGPGGATFNRNRRTSGGSVGRRPETSMGCCPSLAARQASLF